MKRLALIASVAAVIGVWPAASSAATFKGVVVAKQRGALLVASPAGLVRSATGSAAVGSRVVLSGGHATVVGRARTARIRGIVVRRVGTTVFLSSNRHLVAIHTARRLSSVSTNPPPITTTTNGNTTVTTGTPQTGAIVSSQVTIQNGELDEDSSETVGQASGSDIPVQAVVSAIGTGTVTLTVGTQTLTVPLPAGLTLPASVVGQTVTLSLSLNGQNGQSGDDESNDDNGDDDSGTSGGGSDD